MSITEIVGQVVDGARAVDYRRFAEPIGVLMKSTVARARRAAHGLAENRCPKCAGSDLRLSRPRQRWEQLRKQFTASTPVRCCKCGWRGWARAESAVAVALSVSVDRVAFEPAAQSAFFTAAPPRWEELDLDILSIPRRPNPRPF